MQRNPKRHDSENHSLKRRCENETCGRTFVPTEDDRQKYCCHPCSKTQMNRRKNRRRRERELRLERQAWAQKVRHMVRTEHPVTIIPAPVDVWFDDMYMKLLLEDADYGDIPATAHHMEKTETHLMRIRRNVSWRQNVQ